MAGFLILLLAWQPFVSAAQTATEIHRTPAQKAPVQIAIVIDDLGLRPQLDQQALQLPEAIAMAILPMSPAGAQLARQADHLQHEVLIHLPMQSVSGQRAEQQQIHLGMNRQQLQAFVQTALQRIPQAVGLNNHQGSLATRHPVLMYWLMQELALRQIWFLDSRTTADSLALQTAQAHHVPATWRDVFLDDPATDANVQERFQHLIRLARQQGSAVAIGHPRPATLRLLPQLLARLPEDIRLVPPSRLLQHRRASTWQKSLSPSQKAAKNWKPSPSSTCCAEPKSR